MDTDPSSSQPQPPSQPLKNPKYRHVSRSAAKRESVQLLGSIKDLQLHFARAGLEHRAGAGAGVKGSNLGLSSLREDNEGVSGTENYPPSSSQSVGSSGSRATRERRPWKDVELPRVEPEAARREARQIVNTVRDLWGLSAPVTPNSATSLPSSRSLYFSFPGFAEEERRTSEDIRSALVTTATSIRRIRFLALSVSHQTQGSRKASGSSLISSRVGSSSKIRSSFSTPSRPGGMPRAVSQGHAGNERKSSLGVVEEVPKEDVLGDLRKAALEILASIRALEERLRTQIHQDEERAHATAVPSEPDRTTDSPLSPGDFSDVDTSSASRPSSADFGGSSAIFTEPEGEGESGYASNEEEYNLNALAQEDEKHQQTWEERLVLENRQYKTLDDTEWEKEARGTREGIGKWVGVVERLFVVSGDAELGELDAWAIEEGWEGKPLERLHAFLLAHLPLELALQIPPTTSDDFDTSFILRISDGLLLIHAYNTALLSSSKPWGFIPDEDVHDTLTLTTSESATPNSEEGRKSEKEWTFRRVGNLTCWAAGLRHRYQLPIAMPASTTSSSFLPVPSAVPARTPSPSVTGRSSLSPQGGVQSLPPIVTQSGTSRTQRDVPKIEFDPMIVAKRLDGWDGMLISIVNRWVEEVAKEVRQGLARIDREVQV